MWKTVVSNSLSLDKFYLLAYLDKLEMTNWLARTLIIVGISIAATVPAQAQDAAFDLEAHNRPNTQQMAQDMPRPISTTSTTGENQSNLKHWSRFSSSSNRPMFVRVPAGTKTQGSVSHYIRPQWIQPGKAASNTSNVKQPNGVVKRYLANHVPPGACSKNGVLKVGNAIHKEQKKAPVTVAVKRPTHVQILGYGSKSGEVTTSYLPISHHSARTAIACYPRYH